MTFDPTANGWQKFDGFGMIEMVGPFWSKRTEQTVIFGFLPEKKHTNGMGIIHGGMLMTFADHAFGMLVGETISFQRCVTLHLDINFVSSAKPDEFIEARPTIIRDTRSVVFIRGTLAVGEREIISASGIWKKLGVA
jgi:acyl-coenzyme A thioesterase PaaI-like protein